jgi:hypothetical protein
MAWRTGNGERAVGRPTLTRVIAGGALTLDAATIIAHNDASTSNDDIFP